MKVLDLQCRQSHVFEGWFGSEGDFQDQRERGLVTCPMCGDAQIEKRLSAPRLNLGARAPVSAAAGGDAVDMPGSAPSGANSLTAAPPSSSAANGAVPAALSPALQAAWLELARKVVAHTEDVGDRFSQEARRMHYGEVQERSIRGQATAQEALALLEEGIAVMPLPLPAAAKETLQ